MMEKNIHKSLIGITMGDAAGIGPEIICKMFLRQNFRKFSHFVVIGNKTAFDKTIKHYSYNIKTQVISDPEEVYLLKDDTLGIIEVSDKPIDDFEFGKGNKLIGELALKSIDKAVELAKEKKINGIVTAPVNKEVISLTYKNFTGHTEYIAEKLNVKNFNMMMVSSKLKVTLVTTHIAIKEIIQNLTIEKLLNTLENTNDILLKLGYKKPRIAVLGLNPHASDGGVFGDEEEKIIIPAIKTFQSRKNNSIIEGPFPADSFFFKYSQYPVYDAVVAHYHDQGLIPFKIFSFGIGINVTLGLPIIRTSVDHGTAYDISGKNKATDRSLYEALKFAVMLSQKN